MIQAGKLRHLVTIENPTSAIDATGKMTETWTAAEGAWVAIAPVNKVDEWRNSQTQVKATHRIQMRYTSALTANSRLKWGDRYLHISKIRNIDERNTELEIFAWEQLDE